MQNIPVTFQNAILVQRINRFVAEVSFNGADLNVYVPNTGRLSELAIPGAEVLLSPINAKYKFKILYIINRSFPVMIDSTYSNRLFYELLREKKVPGLNHCNSIKREPAYGNHRFDFLLSSNNKDTYIELKSCTLFHNKTGSFPDAVSSRASEHVKALAESGKGKLIFLVFRSDIEMFLPNYHTDFYFYETLKSYQNDIEIEAFTVQYDDKLNIESLKKIPVFIPEVKPEGIYLLLLFNSGDAINSRGETAKHGYYIYCGSSAGNVFKTISSLKKKNGLKQIITDQRFSKIKIVSDIPLVTDSITTDDIKKRLILHGGVPVIFDNNSSTVNSEELIYYETNPSEQPWFWELILEARFGEYSAENLLITKIPADFQIK